MRRRGTALQIFDWTGRTLELAAAAGAAFFVITAIPDLIRYMHIRRI